MIAMKGSKINGNSCGNSVENSKRSVKKQSISSSTNRGDCPSSSINNSNKNSRTKMKASQ